MGVNCREEAGKFIIELMFLAHVIIVTFEGEGLPEAERCWRECLDQRRSIIEEQPGRCRLQILFDDFTVLFDQVFPADSEKKKKTWYPEDDPFP